MSAQRGNILFLILLAIILFVALSYAVNSGMRGGGKDASPEKYKTHAAQIIQYASLVENTINRMRMTSGAPEWGLDFDDGSTGSSVATANASCTSQDCRLFNKSGTAGQIASQQFSEEIIDPRWRALYPTRNNGNGPEQRFYMVQIYNIGTDLAELLLVLEGMKPEACKAINDLLWQNAVYPIEGYGTFSQYTGTLTALPGTFGVFGDGNEFFIGKSAGCVGRETSGYGGDFYYTIMQR